MTTESETQLIDQKSRWNSRAAGWDKDLEDPKHYANFENGYQRFLDFEKSELSGFKGETGLDLGCGTGITSVLLAEKVEHVLLLDLAEEMLKEAHKKVPQGILLNAGATEIPLSNNSVDLAVSRGILVSHLPALLVPKFFGELERTVRPEGKIIFDFMDNPGTADFKLSSPKNVFTLEEMAKQLEGVNFGYIKFEGDDETRVVRVSAVKSK
ncbi:MAG TPA: class I SAM-dependent methyltransferase [Patescibacteria group bacterium]|nr:class I SAM-dependent methyltransferase [Patescibacteria group bacterium]